MAKKKSKKSTAKKIEKAAKKNPKLFFFAVVVLVLIVVGVFALWKLGYIELGFLNKNDTKEVVKEKTYTFDLNTKYYKVSYDEENDVYKIEEEVETLEAGKTYVLVISRDGKTYIAYLEDNTVKEKEVTSIPETESISSVFVYKESNTEGTVFTKYSGGITENVLYTDFQIHFMMLGNDAAGDSIYIKAGDTDILIDAGSKSGSYETTSKYMKDYCKDNKFEYVIATHGDADHISAFPKFFNNYQVDTVIDFTNESYEEFSQYKEVLKSNSKAKRDYFVTTTKTTDTYGSYLKARDEKAKNHYTAGDCYLNKNGAKRQYQLSSKVTMDILYNYFYYDNNNDGKPDSTDENNFSVLTLFTYNDNGTLHKFFLGGDLEKEGEEELAKYYDGSTTEKTLGAVDLYKAGHHGSKTSSNDCLLDILQPKLCVVCCCCGTDEYTGNTDNQFPTQQFIDRIAKWTDKVYVTTILESYEILTAEANSKGATTKTGVDVGKQYIHSSGYKPMNGNIIVSCNGINVGLYASNNLTKLKDTEWFNSKVTLDGIERQMRTWPSV